MPFFQNWISKISMVLYAMVYSHGKRACQGFCIGMSCMIIGFLLFPFFLDGSPLISLARSFHQGGLLLAAEFWCLSVLVPMGIMYFLVSGFTITNPPSVKLPHPGFLLPWLSFFVIPGVSIVLLISFLRNQPKL